MFSFFFFFFFFFILLLPLEGDPSTELVVLVIVDAFFQSQHAGSARDLVSAEGGAGELDDMAQPARRTAGTS